MRISCIQILALFVTLGTVQAQSSNSAAIAELPSCALLCFASALSGGPCDATNTTCMCTNQDFISRANACVLGNCTVVEALKTTNISMTSCGSPVRNKSRHFIATTDTLCVLSGLFVAMRFASKIFWNLGISADDWFLLMTYGFAVAIQTIAIYGTVPNGMGRDIWTLRPVDINQFLKNLWFLEILYFVQVPLTKNTILFLYLRLFPAKQTRRLLWGTIALNSISGLPFVLLSIFQCKPTSAFWRMWDKEFDGYCIDYNAIASSNSAVSIGLDLWILAIALSQVKYLDLDWKKKIAASMMFSVGLFVTIISIIRLLSLIKFAGNPTNPPWRYQDIAMWSILEIDISMICACLPAFRFFLGKIWTKINTPRQPNVPAKEGSQDDLTRARRASSS